MEAYRKINPWRKFSDKVKKEAKKVADKISVREAIEKLEFLKSQKSLTKKDEHTRQSERDLYACVLFHFIQNHQKHPVQEIDWHRLQDGHVTINFEVNRCTPSQGLFQNIREVIPSRFTREFLVHSMDTGYLPKCHEFRMLQIARKKKYFYEISVLENMFFPGCEAA